MAWPRKQNKKSGTLNLRTSVSGLTTWIEVYTPENGWRRFETRLTVDQIFNIVLAEDKRRFGNE